MATRGFWNRFAESSQIHTETTSKNRGHDDKYHYMGLARYVNRFRLRESRDFIAVEGWRWFPFISTRGKQLSRYFRLVLSNMLDALYLVVKLLYANNLVRIDN